VEDKEERKVKGTFVPDKIQSYIIREPLVHGGKLAHRLIDRVFIQYNYSAHFRWETFTIVL